MKEKVEELTVALYEPPADQRVGGLDLAIRSLERMLESASMEVLVNPSLDALGKVAASGSLAVHLHGLWQRNYPAVAAWCRQHDVPYVVSPHGMLEPWAFRHKWWKKWPYFGVVERPLLRKAHRLIATSAEEAENLRAYTGHGQIDIVRLATNETIGPDYQAARRELGWPDEERVLVFLSRIHPKKGLPFLATALEHLDMGHMPPVRMVIVGDGERDYVEQMRTRFERLEQPGLRVDWVGGVWDERKWHYLQGADLFCLPTYSENFGIAVLEACQVGTPVLTTTGTPWRFLEDWGGGLIVEPTHDAVTQGVRAYLREWNWSQTDREALAERTHGHFDPQVILEHYLDLYATVLADVSPTISA